MITTPPAAKIRQHSTDGPSPHHRRGRADKRGQSKQSRTAHVVAGVAALSMSTVIVGAGYFYLKDDFSKAELARQAQLQHQYEDRITDLRAQVDRVTSRQLLDQEAVERRMTSIMLRQKRLGAQQLQFENVIGEGKSLPQNLLDTPRTPDSIKPVMTLGKLRLGTLSDNHMTGSTNSGNGVADNLTALNGVEESIVLAERHQLEKIVALKDDADHKVRMLASILSKRGIRIPDDTGVGGPLIELREGSDLSRHINALDDSLQVLNDLRQRAMSVPHGSPAPGQSISSRFGKRRDPFTKRSAMHGGLDYRARRGTPVLATASGTITKAGRKGGYGKLVEISHGNGITTRYAHLSKIKVKIGQNVDKGTRIGNVGSTGRSTGPHLHYEVRRSNRVMNPIHFVKLEKRLKPYL